MVEVNESIEKAPFPQYPEGADMPGVVTASGRLALRRRLIRLPGGFKLTVRLPEYVNRLSHESTIKRVLNSSQDETEDINVQVSPRPKALKRVREEILQKVKNTPKLDTEARRALIVEGHERDRLAEEFISNQQEVRVDMGEFGEQMARFVVLNPSEGRKTEETDLKPPIFLISGISNDLESMGMLPQEIAFKGRKVITIAYPESWHGNVTDAFGKAAEDSQTFEPHVSFFKQAIENIRQMPDVKSRLGEHEQIELWGYSAGALMVSEMLTDKDFSQKISNAVIIAPASNVDRENVKSAGLDILNDQLKTYLSDFKNTAKMNPNIRAKIEYTQDFRNRQLKTFNALAAKVLRKYNWWEQDMKVADGGKIAVVSYASDSQAQTTRVENEIKQNSNLELLKLPGTHGTPKIEPETLINAVNQAFG